MISTQFVRWQRVSKQILCLCETTYELQVTNLDHVFRAELTSQSVEIKLSSLQRTTSTAAWKKKQSVQLNQRIGHQDRRTMFESSVAAMLTVHHARSIKKKRQIT